MANKTKYHYYILVFTSTGCKYVTGVNYSNRETYWEEQEKPLELTKEIAHDISLGLAWNGFNNQVVMSRYEIENQPYNYAQYNCQFIKKEN